MEVTKTRFNRVENIVENIVADLQDLSEFLKKVEPLLRVLRHCKNHSNSFHQLLNLIYRDRNIVCSFIYYVYFNLFLVDVLLFYNNIAIF